jgi:hypothetical protein
MCFSEWLDVFLEEKGIDLDRLLEVEGPSGLNLIPVCALVEAMKGAPEVEQVGIKEMLVKLDWENRDVLGYLRHLARALAQ